MYMYFRDFFFFGWGWAGWAGWAGRDLYRLSRNLETLKPSSIIRGKDSDIPARIIWGLVMFDFCDLVSSFGKFDVVASSRFNKGSFRLICCPAALLLARLSSPVFVVAIRRELTGCQLGWMV